VSPAVGLGALEKTNTFCTRLGLNPGSSLVQVGSQVTIPTQLVAGWHSDKSRVHLWAS